MYKHGNKRTSFDRLSEVHMSRKKKKFNNIQMIMCKPLNVLTTDLSMKLLCISIYIRILFYFRYVFKVKKNYERY